MSTQTKQVSAGAMRAARFLFPDMGARIYVHGHNKGWSTIEEVAQLIDRETHAAELLEALERILASRSASDYDEVNLVDAQALDGAIGVIAKAKERT